MPNTRLDPEPQPLHGPGDIDLSRGHEHADITLGGFVKFVAWLVVASAAMFAVSWVSLFGLDTMENSERQSAAVRPFPRRDDNATVTGAINSNENGEFSRRPTPLQPSPGHPRTDWKDMDLLWFGKGKEMEEQGFRARPEYANQWVPRRVIPPALVESVTQYIQSMRATTRPATQPGDTPGLRQPEIGGGS